MDNAIVVTLIRHLPTQANRDKSILGGPMNLF